jgi:hypothetical protein
VNCLSAMEVGKACLAALQKDHTALHLERVQFLMAHVFNDRSRVLQPWNDAKTAQRFSHDKSGSQQAWSSDCACVCRVCVCVCLLGGVGGLGGGRGEWLPNQRAIHGQAWPASNVRFLCQGSDGATTYVAPVNAYLTKVVPSRVFHFILLSNSSSSVLFFAERQTDRLTEIQTDRHRQTDRQAYRWVDR